MQPNLDRSQGGKLKHVAVYGLHDWLPLLWKVAPSVHTERYSTLRRIPIGKSMVYKYTTAGILVYQFR